ncbi:MAG: hypothetical protein KBS41_00795, partial [Oscillospiraceae bacterium]|nr:hypothetical protein [Candidatus Equicaccousia limihippi]
TADTTPQEGQNIQTDCAEVPDADTIPTTDTSPKVKVKYNHEESFYSLDEAAQIIQKNMYAKESLEKLQFMAAGKGMSLPDLVDELFDRNEKETLSLLKEEFAQDEEGFLNALLKRREQNAEAFMNTFKEPKEPDINQRLADEFFELCEQVPEISDIRSLPDSVIKEAATSGKSLTLCYLLHGYREAAKKDAMQKTDLQNAKSSIGSLESSATGGENPVISALLKGIHR